MDDPGLYCSGSAAPLFTQHTNGPIKKKGQMPRIHPSAIRPSFASKTRNFLSPYREEFSFSGITEIRKLNAGHTMNTGNFHLTSSALSAYVPVSERDSIDDN
jgi:hypothetical protein